MKKIIIFFVALILQANIIYASDNSKAESFKQKFHEAYLEVCSEGDAQCIESINAQYPKCMSKLELEFNQITDFESYNDDIRSFVNNVNQCILDRNGNPFFSPHSETVNKVDVIKEYQVENKIEFYATSWCQYCKKARAFFKKEGIKYTEYDIEKDVEAKNSHKKLMKNNNIEGVVGVPMFVVKDSTFYGFEENIFVYELSSIRDK